ncbi:MAG TPA: hypothetical protein VGV64_05325 [Thermoplasmata archaeon]|nr:hypothetical protein [Thermoplasmata archaeon]HEV2429252.1 hypothetical protein [Thermoplasmata archaeon]
MTLTKKDVAVPKAAICFGCNQPFEGNPVGRQFRSDLLSPSSQGELAGLYFHPGHLLRYARRRNWTALAEFLEANGPSNY